MLAWAYVDPPRRAQAVLDKLHVIAAGVTPGSLAEREVRQAAAQVARLVASLPG